MPHDRLAMLIAIGLSTGVTTMAATAATAHANPGYYAAGVPVAASALRNFESPIASPTVTRCGPNGVAGDGATRRDLDALESGMDGQISRPAALTLALAGIVLIALLSIGGGHRRPETE